MNCENARRRISETLDGASMDAALSGHLQGCAACARSIERLADPVSGILAVHGSYPSLRTRRLSGFIFFERFPFSAHQLAGPEQADLHGALGYGQRRGDILHAHILDVAQQEHLAV